MAVVNVRSMSEHFQAEIQGLRAVAVGLVIAYHAGLSGVQGGYVGVDVFFVISGYLITALLLREIERNSSISLSGFYARRIRRLVPAALVVLLTTLLVGWFVYGPLDLKQAASSAFATALYVSNLWFIHLSTDYLAKDVGADPLLHTWTLGVEEQFYLVWPLILLAALCIGSRSNFERRLLIAFGTLAATSFALCVWLTASNQPWAFFGSPTRAWEFACGGALALYFSKGTKPRSGVCVTAGWCGAGLVVAAVMALDRKSAFPGFAAAVPVAGTLLLLVAAQAQKASALNRWLAAPPLVLVGDLSYSLYLWHWPVFALLRTADEETSAAGRVSALALVFILSWLTWRLVENPFRYRWLHGQNHLRIVTIGLLVALGSASVAFTTWAVARQALSEPEQRALLAATDDVPRAYRDGCHVDQFSVDVRACAYGAADSKTIVVVFGDSHAAHWIPALDIVATQRGWRLIPFTKSGCPSIDFVPHSKLLNRSYVECAEWRRNVLQRIGELRPQLTILSNSSLHFENSGESKEEWERRIRVVLDSLVDVSQEVFLIRDVPRLSESGPECLSRMRWKDADASEVCGVLRSGIGEAEPVYVAEKAATVGYGNARTIDLNDRICLTEACQISVGGLVKYKDDHHLSATYSQSLAQPLSQLLFSFGSFDANAEVIQAAPRLD